MSRNVLSEPVVITGVGLVTALGIGQDATWQAIREGRSGIRRWDEAGGDLCAATVDIDDELPGRLKAFSLCEQAAANALDDARIDWDRIDRERFGCSICGIMGDARGVAVQTGHARDDDGTYPWWKQWLPNTMCSLVANRYALGGPRLSHSTACASSLISFLTAVRAIRDGQCDIALAGGADAINPLFAAGFRKMRALAESGDPANACRPFDRERSGFVLGEGAGVLVIERLGHALRRGAKIYAEVTAGRMLAEAHHVTGLDAESDALTHLIRITLQSAELEPSDIGYINAHGTGTVQNDLAEMRAIRSAFGAAASNVCVSATKSLVGHCINASGTVELGVTALAMRDGFAPPTAHHRNPDPECTFDCVPLRGRTNRFQHALKLSVAFGGHLVAVALSRWNDAATGFAYPEQESVQPARWAA